MLKAGRTHMQDAVPITLGQEFAAYGGGDAEGARRRLRGRRRGCGSWGWVGRRWGRGSIRIRSIGQKAVAKLAEIAGWSCVRRRTCGGRCSRARRWRRCRAALRGLALEVIRIANDLRLLSSGPNTGFNEIHLPSLQPGSSIMPGKVNPVLAELAAMVGFQVVGNDAAVAMAVQAGQLELNVMMPAMAHNVLQSITILTNTLRELDRAVCAGDYGESGAVRVLCGEHDCAGYGAESLYRVREGGGAGEGVGGDGEEHCGAGAGEGAAE